MFPRLRLLFSLITIWLLVIFLLISEDSFASLIRNLLVNIQFILNTHSRCVQMSVRRSNGAGSHAYDGVFSLGWLRGDGNRRGLCRSKSAWSLRPSPLAVGSKSPTMVQGLGRRQHMLNAPLQSQLKRLRPIKTLLVPMNLLKLLASFLWSISQSDFLTDSVNVSTNSTLLWSECEIDDRM